MKTLHRHLLTAGLLAGLGIGAIAQTQTAPTAPAGPGPQAMQGERHHRDPAQFRARMQERHAKRLEALKQKLQITPAQEGAWGTWTAALKPTPHQRPDRAEFAKLTTPERIDRMKALRAERNARADQREEATKAFYAALSPEQKRTFDQESLRFAGGHRFGGEHGHRWSHGGEQGAQPRS